MPVTYNYDEYGNPYQVLTGEDAQGNPVLITEDNQQSQNWFGLFNHGIDAANNYFGGRGGRNNYNQNYQQVPGATASLAASPSGVSGGLKFDTTTLLIIGLAAFFLLKGK